MDHAVRLPDPPRVGYGIRMNPLAGCLEAVAKCAGESPDYDRLMTVMGGPFRRFWHPTDGGNVDIQYLHPEPIHRASAYLGRKFHLIEDGRDEAIEGIRKSLEQGVPALAFGLVGPPEASLVTGINEDGSVVEVGSYFGPPDPYPLPKENWYEERVLGAPILAVVWGEACPKLSLRDEAISTIRWAVELERTAVRPERPAHLSGLTAFRAWRDFVTSDEAAQMDAFTVGMIHLDQGVMTWERSCAATTLRSYAEALPEVEDEILKAAEAFKEVEERAKTLIPRHDCEELGQWLLERENRQTLLIPLGQAIEAEEESTQALEAALHKLNR